MYVPGGADPDPEGNARDVGDGTNSAGRVDGIVAMSIDGAETSSGNGLRPHRNELRRPIETEPNPNETRSLIQTSSGAETSSGNGLGPHRNELRRPIETEPNPNEIRSLIQTSSGAETSSGNGLRRRNELGSLIQTELRNPIETEPNPNEIRRLIRSLIRQPFLPRLAFALGLEVAQNGIQSITTPPPHFTKRPAAGTALFAAQVAQIILGSLLVLISPICSNSAGMALAILFIILSLVAVFLAVLLPRHFAD